MVMEMVRCIDDLNGVGWMISGRDISYTSSQIAMMICTMILERERERERGDKKIISITLCGDIILMNEGAFNHSMC